MGRVGLGVAVGCAAVTCAIAAALVARRASARARWRRAVALLREFEEGCATPPARLRQVVDAMVVEMHAGLASDGGSKLKMLLTFVDALPSGYGLPPTTAVPCGWLGLVRRLAIPR
jgi:hexokinase